MQEQIESAVAEFLITYGMANKLCPVRFGDDSVKMEKELPFTSTRKQTVSAMVSVDGDQVLVEGGVEFSGWVPAGPKGFDPLTSNPCGEVMGPGWAPFPKIEIPLADPDVFDKLVVILDKRFTEGADSVGTACPLDELGKV